MKNLMILVFLLCMVSCKTNKSQYIYKPNIAIDIREESDFYYNKLKDSITLKLIEVRDNRIFGLINT